MKTPRAVWCVSCRWIVIAFHAGSHDEFNCDMRLTSRWIAHCLFFSICISFCAHVAHHQTSPVGKRERSRWKKELRRGRATSKKEPQSEEGDHQKEDDSVKKRVRLRTVKCVLRNVIRRSLRGGSGALDNTGHRVGTAFFSK